MTEEEELQWQAKISALETKLAEAETRLATLADKKPEADPELAALRSSITQLEAKLAEAEAKLETIKSEKSSKSVEDDNPIPVTQTETLSVPTVQPPSQPAGRKAHNWL